MPKYWKTGCSNIFFKKLDSTWLKETITRIMVGIKIQLCATVIGKSGPKKAR